MNTAYSEQSAPENRPLNEAYGSEPRNTSHEDPGANDPGVIKGIEVLLSDFRELAHDQLQIVSLESQRVGESFVSMVVYGIALGLLVITAWLGLMGVLVLLLIQVGVLPSVSLLTAVLLNLGGAAGLFFAIRARSDDLKFSATVESFKRLVHLIKKDR